MPYFPGDPSLMYQALMGYQPTAGSADLLPQVNWGTSSLPTPSARPALPSGMIPARRLPLPDAPRLTPAEQEAFERAQHGMGIPRPALTPVY